MNEFGPKQKDRGGIVIKTIYVFAVQSNYLSGAAFTQLQRFALLGWTLKGFNVLLVMPAHTKHYAFS